MTREYDPNESVDFIYRTAPQYAKAKAERVYDALSLISATHPGHDGWN